jgi:hypothetical protein
MTERQDPEWVTLRIFGSPWEQELDVRSGKYRHRPQAPTDEILHEWRDGPAPDAAVLREANA